MKKLSKKLQPTRITTDALLLKDNSLSNDRKKEQHRQERSHNQSKGNTQKPLKVESLPHNTNIQIRETKNSNINGHVLTNGLSERNLRHLGAIAEQRTSKQSLVNSSKVNNNRESPKMFLMSPQEQDLRKSEIFNENRNSNSRISNHNMKHKTTKSEAIQINQNPSSTFGGSVSNYTSINRGNGKNFHQNVVPNQQTNDRIGGKSNNQSQSNQIHKNNIYSAGSNSKKQGNSNNSGNRFVHNIDYNSKKDSNSTENKGGVDVLNNNTHHFTNHTTRVNSDKILQQVLPIHYHQQSNKKGMNSTSESKPGGNYSKTTRQKVRFNSIKGCNRVG